MYGVDGDISLGAGETGFEGISTLRSLQVPQLGTQGGREGRGREGGGNNFVICIVTLILVHLWYSAISISNVYQKGL